MFPHAKRSFGQHFLINPSVLDRMIQVAEIKAGDLVLEIGPGTGVLTDALLSAGAHVMAMEIDRELITALRAKQHPHLEIIQGDALILPWPNAPYKLVSNLPYNITSDVLFKAFSLLEKPDLMVLLLQKEVVDRITAKPPKMSLLSMVCQLSAQCEKIRDVSRGSFRPIPRVDSAIVKMRMRPLVDDPEKILILAKAGFSSKRRQLHNNLAKAGFASSDRVKDALLSLGLPASSRAENLTVEHWIALPSLL